MVWRARSHSFNNITSITGELVNFGDAALASPHKGVRTIMTDRNRSQTGRLLAVTLTLFMFLVALTVFQNAWAVSAQPPVPLAPPFAFEADAESLARDESFPGVPPGSPVLLNEQFGPGFLPVVGGMQTGWRIFTDTNSVAAAHWNRVIPAISSAFQDTAWASCGPCDGSGPDPDTDNYAPNTGTWLIYGPVNLQDYAAIVVDFDYRLGANPTVDGSGTGDFFGVGVSTDGSKFSGVQYTGNLFASNWLSGTFNLSNLSGQTNVYIGFYFHSNADGNTARGVFVDNVRVRARPFEYVYFPVIANNIATPTPTTPPYLYNYTFDQPFTNQHFQEWGNAYSKGDGAGGVEYEQGLFGGGIYLYNTKLNLTSMAGPDKTHPTNFELSVDLDVTKGKDDARYGLIFGAESKTFSRAGNGEPRFNADSTYYKLGLRFPSANNNNTPTRYQLERCNGQSFSCIKLIDNVAMPGGLADGDFDRLVVRRQGSSITVIVNGATLQTVNDGTYTGSREFGVFIQSAGANNATTPLEIVFDNIRVTQLP
jgi:hypothetical protein